MPLGKVIYKAWLQLEKKGEDLDNRSSSSDRHIGTALPNMVSQSAISEMRRGSCDSADMDTLSIDTLDEIITFSIGSEEVICGRQRIASLSVPFDTMLNGGFTESKLKQIDFSQSGVSVEAMRAVDEFSRTGSLPDLDINGLLEVLTFANRFCCEHIKEACDSALAKLVHTSHDALILIEYGLEESASLLVASCMEVLLQGLPGILHNPQVVALLSRADTRMFMKRTHSAFALYSLLSQVAMENDTTADQCIIFLECLRETAMPGRQKALALHQLGCSMLERKLYLDAYQLFEAAVEEGHHYSLAGLARVKYKLGHRKAALATLSSNVCNESPLGWMYVERSLYCDGEEKIAELNRATELDPTLTYPYKYRAARLMDESKVDEAIAEINRILGFKVTTDCLELRVYFCLTAQDYAGATRDVRALLTLNSKYTLYSGRVRASKLLDLLSPHIEQWNVADCWMQLYDRWSSVDDIGSLAVVHQMLEADPSKALLFFRQSLLLLRLNCPKSAMESLQRARENAPTEHERLVYEGWILYDTGHCEEAIMKAQKSIDLQRSFEAFFLKAYALADTNRDTEVSKQVVDLLKEALKCPSDGLRKGQALNNLGSVYVDCGELDLAADAYFSALEIRHTRAHQGLARVYYLKNDRSSAYEEMTKLIEKAKSNASAYEKRSEYCERSKSVADLNMVTQLDPLRTYPYRYRAAVLMDNHKEKEAIDELSRAIAFKVDLHLLHLRAAFYECIGDAASALRDCRAALSIDPTHMETMQLHGRVYSREP
ncbi:hypothetical protein KP509_23G083700 [Ceratopteris richardii]|nr:hypothetical protein KP509_23G083700 [Ceratopteris richardii]